MVHIHMNVIFIACIVIFIALLVDSVYVGLPWQPLVCPLKSGVPVEGAVMQNEFSNHLPKLN